MTPAGGARNGAEVRDAFARSRSGLFTVLLLSAVLNVLLLGGSLYMMLVYDQVLPSHSESTLVGLLAIVVVVYLFQGFFDVLRSRMLADIGAALDLRLTGRVNRLVMTMALGSRAPGDGLQPLRDLEQIRSFLSNGGPVAFIDLPWVLFFLGVLFLLHWWLGLTVLVGAIVLATITLVATRATGPRTERLSTAGSARNAMAEEQRRHAEVIRAMGMLGRMESRWVHGGRSFFSLQQRLTQLTGTLGGASKVFRLFLQSLVLTVGALLVIRGEATGGVIFASAIIATRALAPIDQAIANWRGFVAARQGWIQLTRLLGQLPDTQGTTTLPAPVATLSVERLALMPPGSARLTLQDVDFGLRAGDALAVIGPSAAGKSSLVRAVLGIWRPANGGVRLDGASIDQWPGDSLGHHIGYLPQNVELMDATVAQNIARLDPGATSDEIIAAGYAAGVHDLIVRLPGGYDTPVGRDGMNLSAGQRQRIALARALFRDPFLVVLDEPNSNLDAEGEAALARAISAVRERQGIVLLVAHRSTILSEVNLVLYMRDGRVGAFGQRDDVLARILANQPKAMSGEGVRQAVTDVPA